MIDLRRSAFGALCARAALAGLLASLPGPRPRAQSSARVIHISPSIPVATPTITPVSAVAAAPASLLAASLPPQSPTAVPLAAAGAPSAETSAPAASLDAEAFRSDEPSAAGISGDEAKSKAARLFDSAAERTKPSLSSLIIAARAVGPRKSGENPEPDHARRLYGAISQDALGGELLDPEEVLKTAASLGLDRAEAARALDALADEGRLARLSGGRYLYTTLLDRHAPFSGSLPRSGGGLLGAGAAIDALRLLNGKDKDLALLAQAVSFLGEVLREKPGDDIRVELASLYRNAAMEFGRSIASSLLANASRERAPDEAVIRERKRMVSLFEDVHYDGAKPTRTLDPDGKRMMIEGLDQIIDGIRQDVPSPIKDGFQLLRAFLASGALPGKEAPEAARGGVPARINDSFRQLPPSEFKTLLEYGTDITLLAAGGKTRPLIGRKAEIRQMVKTLLRVEKNNPLVIGEKGIGKTAVVNGLARMIVKGEIPELSGKNIVKIDLNKVVAGTQYRGQFEERLHKIIAEAKKSNGRVILFIDEIHMIVGAGSTSGTADASQILKESLADGSIALIGATTMDEYRRVEKDGALMRRFNPVKLPPPTKDEAEAILEGVKASYEGKHKVSIPSKTIKAAVSLAARYVTDRHLPDSALDLMDDAAAEVELKASESGDPANARREVTPEDVAREISLRTGIPAGKLGEDDRTKLKNLPADMKGQVIAQDEAVEKVAEAVQQGKLGYRDPKQPIASFVFLGPTGVGKTELARALARAEFGSEKNMLRLDMSEYQEKHSVARLISAPPGYVGHDEGGQLTEAIRRNPYQVVLLDEIEKAHPDVLDVLLQVLEDGRLTDGQGRTVDFSNTIIIMTSNIGGSLASETGSPAAGAAGRKSKYVEAFKQKYRPEFVNRVGEDRVIVFNELSDKAALNSILDLRLAALEAQLRDKSLKVALTSAAREEILRRALENARYGARPVKQIVDREINRALKDAELAGRIASGGSVLVDWDAAAGRFRAGVDG